MREHPPQRLARLAFVKIAFRLRRALAPSAFLREQRFGERLPRIGGTRIVAGIERLRVRADPRALRLERGLEAAAVHVREVPDPVVAPCEHVGHQARDSPEIVVQVLEQALDMRRSGARILAGGFFDKADRGERRGIVELACVVDRLGQRAEARQHRHLARKRRAERIDGLDAQPRRVGGERIAAFGELLEHALAHLGRGLARERDGDDLLGLDHRVEQREIALDQELGLARAGRRLDDERARRIERARALGGIRRRGLVHSPSPASPNPASRSWMRQNGFWSQ